MDSGVLPAWFHVHDAKNDAADGLRSVVETAFYHQGARVLQISNAKPTGDALAFWHHIGSVLGASYSINREAAVDTVLHGEQYWMDVRYEPSRQQSYRYASTAQPLHNDGAHVTDPADYGLFFMERQAASGGESVFIDAGAVAEIAAADEPQLFRDLTEVPVHMALTTGPGSKCPILQRDGTRWIVRWNYYRVVPGQGPTVEGLRERFRQFLEQEIPADHLHTVRLNSGDALIFDDRAVLHARTAFTATASGDRLLWKTYFLRS